MVLPMTVSPFSLQFMGSGNARSKPPINYNTSALIRSNNHSWLIDCGILCPLALHHFQIPLDSIDGVFISHLHGDHVLGLEELCFSCYFNPSPRKINLYRPSGLQVSTGAPLGYDIWDNCLRAALETTVPDQEGTKLLKLSDYAHVHTIYPEQPFDIFDMHGEIFQVEHVAQRPSYGLMLNHNVAYTSDCRFDPHRIESLLNQNITTIFHDVCFYRHCPSATAVHTTFDELAGLPADMRKHIVLMHFGDDTTDNDFKTAESLGFRIARPGMIFQF